NESALPSPQSGNQHDEKGEEAKGIPAQWGPGGRRESSRTVLGTPAGRSGGPLLDPVPGARSPTLDEHTRVHQGPQGLFLSQGEEMTGRGCTFCIVQVRDDLAGLF